MKYYTMEHKGGLDESVETKKEISENEFKERFKEFKYEPYCYDKRIKSYRFIISNIEKNYKHPIWLLMEEE